MLTPSIRSPTTISRIPGGAVGGVPNKVGGGGGGDALSATLNCITEDFAFPAASYALTMTT